MKYVCENCSIKFSNSHKRVFCSSKCSQEYRFKITVAKLDTTNDFSISEVRTIRKYLIFRNGNVCYICSNYKWVKKQIPLILDHIDGNSDNWRRDNIRMICPNCDALLPTYKARNKGNGRYTRRQRYQSGKSY